MKQLWLIIAFVVSGVAGMYGQEGRRERTAFQTGQPWKPTTDTRADVAIVYGVGGNPSEERSGLTFEERVQSWRDKGYTTHFMTGIAWGEYQDYFTGAWDGRWHLDEGQVTREGDTIWHGHMVPYIVPSMNFIRYMKERHIKRVIDAGIDAIYLEEPEFWARGGYSEAFKREWKAYYGFDWRPQHESAENTYLSNKLKYHLYYRALDECFTYAKAYGKSKGMDVRCYVPTHSLVNYAQWQIVSPEASLASLDCVDGYIAQVWTGTSREPNYFDGVARERVFETAFLEYGCMESMTAPTGRKVFFLTDPIEDRARDWADYKRNYQATFTAKLLYPANNNYEVMPWPDRIYEGLYRVSATSDRKERIPRFYSTQMQVMINSLNDMPLSDNKVSGPEGIGVLMANSLMFQRAPRPIVGYDDPQLSNFYGLAMPLVKRGVPVRIVHLENVGVAHVVFQHEALGAGGARVARRVGEAGRNPAVLRAGYRSVPAGAGMVEYGRERLSSALGSSFRAYGDWRRTGGGRIRLWRGQGVRATERPQGVCHGRGRRQGTDRPGEAGLRGGRPCGGLGVQESFLPGARPVRLGIGDGRERERQALYRERALDRPLRPGVAGAGRETCRAGRAGVPVRYRPGARPGASPSVGGRRPCVRGACRAGSLFVRGEKPGAYDQCGAGAPARRAKGGEGDGRLGTTARRGAIRVGRGEPDVPAGFRE